MARSTSMALFAAAPMLATVFVAHLGNDQLVLQTDAAQRELQERVERLELVAQGQGGVSQLSRTDLPVGTVVAFAGVWPPAREPEGGGGPKTNWAGSCVTEAPSRRAPSTPSCGPCYPTAWTRESPTTRVTSFAASTQMPARKAQTRTRIVNSGATRTTLRLARNMLSGRVAQLALTRTVRLQPRGGRAVQTLLTAVPAVGWDRWEGSVSETPPATTLTWCLAETRRRDR